MSRNHFYLLPRFRHFQINSTNERLNKVAFSMNHLNSTMKPIYCPTENLSLDESMVLWQNRPLFFQYIKGKKQYGVKFYELCESDGLVLRSFIYNVLPYPDTLGLGQTEAIVLKLMKDFLERFLQFCKACQASFKAENIHL